MEIKKRPIKLKTSSEAQAASEPAYAQPEVMNAPVAGQQPATQQAGGSRLRQPAPAQPRQSQRPRPGGPARGPQGPGGPKQRGSNKNQPKNNKPKRKGGLLNKLIWGTGGCVILIILLIAGLFAASAVGLQVPGISGNGSLSGKVTSSAGGPIAGATVTIAEREALSGEAGAYYVGNIPADTYELTASAPGYADFTQSIEITPPTFGYYGNVLDITLDIAGEGVVTGKFLTPDQVGYDFLNDSVLVDDETYKINRDGTFVLNGVATGSKILTLQSVNYVDEEIPVEVTTGEADVGEVTLTASGDFTGSLRSFIREDLVESPQITAEGVSQEQIEITENGESFRIKDLEIGTEYKVRISHPQYVDRDYTQTAVRGESTLFGLNMVEDGHVVYLNKPGRSIEIFASEYDGMELRQLTENNFEPYGEYLDPDGTVYFMSSRDSVRSRISGRALVAYAVPVAGGNPQRITTSTNLLGDVRANFTAKLMTNVTTLGADREDRLLETMNLRGQDRTKLFEIDDGEIYDTLISDNGKYVAFGVLAPDGSLNGVYRGDIESGASTQLVTQEPIQIFDISANGNSILYSSRSRQTDLVDLFIFTVNDGKNRKIRSAFNGSMHQFVGDSENDIIFFAQRSENSNIFHLEVGANSENQLTNFNRLEGVEAVYQQNGYILYQSNRGLVRER